MVDKFRGLMRMPSELEQPPLSADLDWMLTSSQVGVGYILETLVRRYYTSLRRFAHILLDDEKKAERVVQETIQSAIRNRHRYRSQGRAEIWLFQLILETGRYFLEPAKGEQEVVFTPAIAESEGLQLHHERDLWQTWDEFGRSTRLLICLNYLFGFDPVEISQVLGTREAEVRAQLNDTHRWLHRCKPPHIPDGEAVENWVREILERRWPQPYLDETEQDRLIRSFQRQIEQGDLRKKRFVIVQQILYTTFIVVLIALTGWVSNTMLRTKPPVASKASVTPINTLPSQLPGTTIARSVLPFAPPVPPLSLSSSIDAIRQRMFISRSLWKKAWVDALLIRYGPPGYVGPAQVYRNQMWVSNPTQGDSTERQLVIAGLVYDEPIYALYAQGEQVYTVDLSSSVQYTYPRGNANPIHDLASPVHLGMYGYDQRGMLDGSYLSDMIYSAGLVSMIGDLEIVELNRYLDRDILILTNELPNGFSEQLMVDTYTGMVLSWMGYLTRDPETVLAEIIVLDLEFDAEFPGEAISSTFFWREPVTWIEQGESALGELDSPRALASALMRADTHTARPRITRRISPPGGYDPSNSCLTFQWPEQARATGDEQYPVEIFADGYFLGETHLSDPWQIICERAADGSLIACLEPPRGLRNWLFAPSNLTWFDLSNPGESTEVLPEAVYISSDFAFSPDSRYLAFWACLERGKACSVYLHDTHTRQNVPITPLKDGATFFVWSPDSNYLAFVGAGPNLQHASSLLVVDAHTGEVLDEGAFLWPELALPVDSPVREWGVKFPPVQGEFEACNRDH